LGAIPEVEEAGAARLLKAMGLDPATPLVAFDIVSRTVSKAARGKPQVQPEYKSIGDKRLFDGIDSALKAALHWRQQDYSSFDDFAGLNIPICVFGVPFWDVRIDGGTISDPTIREKGHQILSLPRSGSTNPGSSTEHPAVIVVTIGQLALVTAALGDLWEWFRNEMKVRLLGMVATP
jgi:hypothetical protein